VKWRLTGNPTSGGTVKLLREGMDPWWNCQAEKFPKQSCSRETKTKSPSMVSTTWEDPLEKKIFKRDWAKRGAPNLKRQQGFHTTSPNGVWIGRSVAPEKKTTTCSEDQSLHKKKKKDGGVGKLDIKRPTNERLFQESR